MTDAFAVAAASIVGDPNLGEDVLVTPAGGVQRTVRAVWQDGYAGATVTQAEAVLLVAAEGNGDIGYGATATIGGVDYVVRSREPDGRGLVELAVERA